MSEILVDGSTDNHTNQNPLEKKKRFQTRCNIIWDLGAKWYQTFDLHVADGCPATAQL